MSGRLLGPLIIEEIGRQGRLGVGSILVPPVAAVVGEAAGFGVAMPVIVGEAIAQWRGGDIRLAAVFGIFDFRIPA